MRTKGERLQLPNQMNTFKYFNTLKNNTDKSNIERFFLDMYHTCVMKLQKKRKTTV